MKNYKILLASSSPRRQEILKDANIDFSIVKLLNNDESFPNTVFRENIPIFIAQKKSQQYSDLKKNEVLITADTIVWIDNKVLGKPNSFEDAFYMLKLLSNREHFVFTGVCLRTLNKEKTFFAETIVKFAKISNNDIKFYIENFKPYDKAGAYGIQEWIGKIAVESISGSFYNVMGLPIQKLIKELKYFK